MALDPAPPAPAATAPVRTDADAEVAALLGEGRLACLPGYLEESAWRALATDAARLQAEGAFRQARVGRGASLRLQPEVRRDYVHWIDPLHASLPQRSWLVRMEALRRCLNENLYLGLFGFETHLALYPPGAFYRTHLDRFSHTAHRVVTVLLYLNEAWSETDGGRLRVYLEEPDRPPCRDIDPTGGKLVAFMSADLHHEVLPARRERLALVGWFTSRG